VGQRLSAFKVPTRVFVTDALPKGPTGKISRRFMVDAFINKKQDGGGAQPGAQRQAGWEGLGWCWRGGASSPAC
jgi:S-adenosylmethionine synthetase